MLRKSRKDFEGGISVVDRELSVERWDCKRESEITLRTFRHTT